MPTPLESRAALEAVTNQSVAEVIQLFGRLDGRPEVQRADLLDSPPGLIGYYSDGTAALAADFYEEERELARVRSRFRTEPIVLDRSEKIGRSIAWAAEPLVLGIAGASDLVESRLAEVIQFEVAKPYRDTITTNRRRDPDAVGWRRISNGGCRFCVMLADRGAVFKAETARFAAHPNCNCVAQPVFTTNDTGEEASVIQYMASRRARSPKQRAELRDYLNTYYGDFPG